MTVISTSRILGRTQAGIKQDVSAMFRTAADQIITVLRRNAGGDDKIPRNNERAILREAGPIIQRLFVGTDDRSPFGENGLSPLAPFPRILNRWYVLLAAQMVQQSQKTMRQKLPDDLYNWLKTAKAPPVRETLLNASGAGQALATYDPMHTWVDPNGYVLSDRIWNAAINTRRKVDALLADGIRQGMSATRLAKRLEQFLLPERRSLRTTRPYGSDGSFDAMRLARTEITAAFGRLTLLSGQLNPFVTGFEWRTSGSHPKLDECDSHAAGSPYTASTVPSYPAHPFCLCLLLQILIDDPKIIVDQYREWFNDGQDPPITPVVDELILILILGDFLYNLLKGYLAGLTD